MKSYAVEPIGDLNVHCSLLNHHCRRTSKWSVFYETCTTRSQFLRFNSISEHKWSKQQLCSHWDAMRRAHKHLSELLNCSGVEYNPSTSRIVASTEWWTWKIKVTHFLVGYKCTSACSFLPTQHVTFSYISISLQKYVDVVMVSKNAFACRSPWDVAIILSCSCC